VDEERSTLLVVEDDAATRTFLADNLTADGYELLVAECARDGLRVLERKYPDLALIDLRLPDHDGLELIRQVREADGVASRVNPDTPLLAISGRSSELDRLRGFERGVDDYVVKPFSYPELLARVRALLRRSERRARLGRMRVGDLEVDPASREVRMRGRRVELSQKEFALLRTLAAEPTRVFTKEELLRNVWGFRAIGLVFRLGPHLRSIRMTTPLRLDGYVRVSRTGKREGDSFISPSVQREQIERWAHLRGVEIAAWHEDLDQSGGKLSRPGLDAMLTRIRNGETGGVVVARLDRLSRAGVADALKLVEELHEHGAQLAAIDLGIDPTTPVGEFTMTVMLGLARMERQRLSEGWRIARQRAVERGLHIAPRAPFGYTREEDGSLSVNGGAEAVRQVFARRAAGASWLELARLLDCVAPRPNGGRWTRQTVATMIASRTYLGEAHHGDHRKPNAHPAIVSIDEFEAAQRVNGSRTPRGAYLLSGIARCASCRHTLRGSSFRQGRTRVYKCAKNHSSGRCPAPVTVMADVLDGFVERRFLDHLDAFEVRGGGDDGALSEARAAVEEARQELEAFQRDTRAAGPPGLFAAGLAQRVAALERAEDDLGLALGSAPALSLPPVGDTWNDLTLEERRHILTAALDAVFVRRSGRVSVEQRARVLFRGEGASDLPVRGAQVDPFTWDDEPSDVRMAPA
jgi:site-specific DNA recombinase